MSLHTIFRFIQISVLSCIILSLPRQQAFADNPVIQIDGTDTGRVFDGIGALSAGASSRLLVDYPAKQRSEILDYLFKPNFGAELQINKVEIGGDANSTDGSEASHERTLTDTNYHRGYEWWLMKESKQRNPAEKLYILEWAAPGWINPGVNSVFAPANYKYIIDFIRHAKSDYGLTIDYVGGWNERGFDKSWYEGFKPALAAAGLSSVKIVSDDSFGWDVGKAAAADSAFANSFDIIGQHYPDSSPAVLNDVNYQASFSTGKTIWFSEMGSQDFDSGAANLARVFNQSYIDNRATANINWSTIWSVYNGLPYYGCGLMLANEPWSGHYQVGKSIWVCAQTTQFAQPGWQYLDHACGFLSGKRGSGSYVTLKSPNGSDYSVIIETLDAKAPQTQSFVVDGGFKANDLHVWATNLSSTNPADWFVKGADIYPTNGAFSIDLLPGYVYSLTTTTGQSKGLTTPPQTKILPLPFRENFSEYAVNATPKYFSDQQGAFEVAPAPGGRSGKCLRQVITTQPILWSGNGDPSTVVGDSRWTDYTISSDVLLEQPGYVDLIGRMDSTSAGASNLINGYHLRLADSGKWSLFRQVLLNDTALASGNVPCSVNTWHRLKLSFSGLEMSAWIDGNAVASNIFAGDFDHGLAGFQVSSWQNADFQNFSIDPASGGTSKLLAIRPVAASATSENSGYEAARAVDGDLNTFWHTKFDPVADALPQSITVDLGSTKNFDTLLYSPRQDGNGHGNITKYTVGVSTDGNTYSQVATGTWDDNSCRKMVHFPQVTERFIRLTALEGDGGFAAAAELEAAVFSPAK